MNRLMLAVTVFACTGGIAAGAFFVSPGREFLSPAGDQRERHVVAAQADGEGLRKSEGLIRARITAYGADGTTGTDARTVDEMGSAQNTAVVKLNGTISVRAALEQVHYSWILPEGVRLRSGELEGTIPRMSQGESLDVQIEIEKRTPGEQRIVFRSWQMRGDEANGNAAIYLIPATLEGASGAAMVSAGTDDAHAARKATAPSSSAAANVPPAPRSPEEFRRRAIQ